MASRALATRLTMTVSNWLASASTAEESFRNVQRECNAGPEHRLQHIGDALQLTGDVEDFPFHRVTTREDQQLVGQLSRSVGCIRNRIDISPLALRRKIAPPKKIG